MPLPFYLIVLLLMRRLEMLASHLDVGKSSIIVVVGLVAVLVLFELSVTILARTNGFMIVVSGGIKVCT